MDTHHCYSAKDANIDAPTGVRVRLMGKRLRCSSWAEKTRAPEVVRLLLGQRRTYANVRGRKPQRGCIVPSIRCRTMVKAPQPWRPCLQDVGLLLQSSTYSYTRKQVETPFKLARKLCHAEFMRLATTLHTINL